MIVMVFEFRVDPREMADYLAHSTSLRPHLASIDGFISVERFASEREQGKFVTIGYFEDEDAVRQWRNLPEHREAQASGRNRYFTDYRLVMAETLRDYGSDRRTEVPKDSRVFIETGDRGNG
jgi:heme-degrading monooxygenase HmoA